MTPAARIADIDATIAIWKAAGLTPWHAWLQLRQPPRHSCDWSLFHTRMARLSRDLDDIRRDSG